MIRSVQVGLQALDNFSHVMLVDTEQGAPDTMNHGILS